MKKTFLTISALMASMFLFSDAMAQKDSIAFRTFGIGLHIEQIFVSDIESDENLLTPNKIVVPLTLTNHFRFEVEFGIRNRKQDDAKTNTTGWGVGALGMIQRGRLNIPIGVRVKLTSFKATVDGNTDYTAQKTSYGPVIGGEYFLGNNFSFGGEVGFMLYSSSSKDYGSPAFPNQSQTTKENGYNTESGLQLRFYF